MGNARSEMSLMNALRDWRQHWPTAQADPLTLTGEQADEVCRLLLDAQPAVDDIMLAIRTDAPEREVRAAIALLAARRPSSANGDASNG